MPSKHASNQEKPEGTGALYMVATPIGNLGDITLRALETLRSVHRIAAEDTRHTKKLLTHFDIHKPLVSYHAHNAHFRGPELVEKMQKGEEIALVTDAGSPGISDPGTLLVHQALEAGIQVIAIPGPTALIAALICSGLPTHPFAFLGFPPNRGSGRQRFFSAYADLTMTLILYEAPQRLQKTLEDILLSWGDRKIAVARELTKKFEEIFRGRVSEAQNHFSKEIKGELTLVVEGRDEKAIAEDEKNNWQEELCNLLQTPDMSVKEASSQIALRFQLPKRLVYQEAIKTKKQ
jgi:16S rRNA (cytidine1402-2'-O)-methyltransferase